MAKESHIQKRILAWARETPGAHGVRVHGSAFGRSGTPDLLISAWGRFVAVETKTPRGRLSKIQKYEHGQWNQAGAWVLIPRDFDEFERTVELLRRTEMP